MQIHTAQRIQNLAQMMQTAHPSQLPAIAQELKRISMTAPRGGDASAGAPQDVPAVGADWHPPALASTIQPLLAPSRWLVVPSIPVVAPQTMSPGERLEFQFSGGVLIGMRGTSVGITAGVWSSDDLSQAACGVEMRLNNMEPLVTNGQGEDWSWFSDLFAPGVQWSPLLRRVTQGDVLNLNFRNRLPVAQATSIQPSLTFAFLADRDLEYLVPRG